MFRYITTRLLYMVPVLWLVVSVVFLLIHLVPGDPIQQMLGENASSGGSISTTGRACCAETWGVPCASTVRLAP